MRRIAQTGMALLATCVLAVGGALAQQRGYKIYISADMEGVTGAVTSDQLGPSGFEYQRFREIMTAEVLAAIEGAKRAGATQFLVSDSHGNGQNLLIERFPDDVQIIRSWPRPLGMMEGIDSTFDGAIFIGYHASTTNLRGVRAHTMSSANFADIRLNDVSMPEAGINAAVAGHFGVPIIMISGDDAAVAETQALIGDVVGAVVKWNISFHAARTLTPAAGQALIAERAEQAVRQINTFGPYRLDAPVELVVRFKAYRPAEMMAYLRSVERVDAHTIRYVANDVIDVSWFLRFVTGYRVDLQP